MKKLSFVFSVLIVLSMLLAPTGSVLAQDQQPPAPLPPFERKGGSEGSYGRFLSEAPQTAPSAEMQAMADELGLLQDKEGRWYMQGSSIEVSAAADISAQASADSFGYGYKSIPYNWVDAANGGIALDLDNYVGVFQGLPFEFPYYEDSYDYVMVSAYGYLQFGDINMIRSQSPLLDPSEPNTVVAPFWSYLYYGEGAGVYTNVGEDEKGQYIVFEWVNMQDPHDNVYTFEVLLYDNGSIVFQYGDMAYGGYGWYCGSAGIEDWTGTVGRATLKFCNFPKGYRGVQFTRPASAARVKIFPLEYGAFGAPGTEASVYFEVNNTGDLDDDVIDFTIKSKWPVTLYDSYTLAPLTDTDGDRKVDTGPLCTGCGLSIMAKTQVPATARIGNSLTSQITAASSLKTSRKVTIKIQTTVPVSFAQGYQRNYANWTAYISQVAGVIPTENNGEWEGQAPAVTTLKNGNVLTLWAQYNCEDICIEELFYTIHDKQGALLLDATKIQDLSGQTDVYDFNGAAAVAPDGSIGVIWMNEVYTTDGLDDDQYLYNIYFAVLNEAGVMVYGPADITKNTDPFTYSDYLGKRFYEPHIAATGDNHFALSWRQNEAVDDYSQDNIYTAVVDTAGATVQNVTERTFDRGDTNDDYYDENSYYEPSVTQLTNNRFLLSWFGWEGKKWRHTYKVYYQVFDSNGGAVNPVKTVTIGAIAGYSLDAAQMTNGQIILAYSKGTKQDWNSKANIYYIVLNDLTYKKAKGPVPLTHKGALTGSGQVSVTTDNLGHAVLTWADRDSTYAKHLYYAMLGKNGAVLTKPAVVDTNYGRGDWGGITLNAYGYGNTSYIP